MWSHSAAVSAILVTRMESLARHFPLERRHNLSAHMMRLTNAPPSANPVWTSRLIVARRSLAIESAHGPSLNEMGP
jgi:hypothetical protein